MVIKVGINGFGRVGRVVFRTCLEHPDVEIAAINDPAIEVDYICYLIKFDSTHGTLKSEVSHTEDEIKIDELRVKVFQQKQPPNIPWHAAGVQYVVEASGMFTSLDKASGHLGCDGVKRVIVTAPSVDVPMVILGVNENKIKPEYNVISCGSSTLYCLAPIVKVLEDNYGLEEGFITSIHAMTPSLKPLDGLCLRGKHWRDHRSITQNIIPAVTGACRALGRVIPTVRDKVCGLAFRVPIANVSVLDLTVRLKKFTSLENIVAEVEKLSKSSKQTIIKITTDESVSSDFIGDRHSCILDVGSCLQLKPNAFKLICWYENEYSYSCRVVDLILFSEAQLNQLLTNKNKITYLIPKNVKRQDVNQQTECTVQEILNRKKIVESKKHSSSKLPAMCPKPQLHQILLKRPIAVESQIPCMKSDPKRHKELLKKTNTYQPPPANACQNNQIASLGIKTVDCFKAQEKLDKVKQEFTKMVSITEDLLRKSNTSRMQLTSLEASKEELNLSLNNVRSNTSASKLSSATTKIETTCTKKASPVIFDVSGDKASGSTVNSKSMYLHSSKEDFECISYEKDQSNYSMLLSEHKSTLPSSLTSESLNEVRDFKESINIALKIMSNGQETTSSAPSSNRNFMSKTLTNILDGFSKNFTFTNKTVPAEKGNDDGLTTEKEHKESFDKVAEADDNKIKTTLWSNSVNDTEAYDYQIKTDFLSNSVKNDVINNKITTLKVLKLKEIDSDNNSATITNEENEDTLIKADGFICGNEQTLLDIDCHQKVDHDHCNDTKMDEHSENKDNSNDCGDVNIITDIICEREVVHKRGSSYTSMPGSLVLVADDESRCASSDYRSKQDIFDKLDSASDSDNSFEVDGKKSQVIKISDLTNSLDDLDRLDKICRIMEISDELSSKLFSTLDDNSEGTSVNKKKWSFKDLCEKINLDEFCNKVFGK